MNAYQYVVPALIGAIVAISGFFVSRRSETKKHLEILRTTAYVDLIRGIAGLAVIQRGPVDTKEKATKGSELIMLVTDAKSRIVLYGSRSVVASLAKFLRAGDVLDSPERAREFTAICQQMRNDTRPNPGPLTDTKDAHFLLFGFEMEKYLGAVGAGLTETVSKK